MIIGLTGFYTSGKDTVANYLVERSFIHYSLSDEIREELKKRKLSTTRDNLINVGNELREKEGPDILARKVMEKIDYGRHHVITSIRNKQEVQALREYKDFILVNVTAPQEIRFERLKQRNKPGDIQTLEEFKEKELKEQSDDVNSQQLHIVTKLADVTISNEKDLEDLYKKLSKFLQDWWPKLCARKLSWDEYFMSIAMQVGKRANCMKRKVGTVIVKEKRVITTGYNGTPRGLPNCDEHGCKRCNSFGITGEDLGECICSHAEENAIIQGAYHGVSVKNCTLYTTLTPCTFCAKLIINSGIIEVVYNNKYPLDKGASELMKKAGVKVRGM